MRFGRNGGFGDFGGFGGFGGRGDHGRGHFWRDHFWRHHRPGNGDGVGDGDGGNGDGDGGDGDGGNNGGDTGGVVIGAVRPIDGVGTVEDNPEFGAVGQQLLRLAEAGFEDGIGELAGADRPAPREISNALNAQDGDEPNHLGGSEYLWAWGQFIDHDLDLTLPGETETANIAVPTGDEFFDPTGAGGAEIPFTRVDPLEGTGVDGPREYANAITSFIDASVVYGSTSEVANALRVEGGKLLLDEDGYLVENPDGGVFAGDIRANENAALQSIQTLFAREHNRWVDELSQRDPTLTEDELYQAARTRVEAEVQAITFNEFLPVLVGQDAIDAYQGYDPTVNPGISVEFSTAVYRLGHSLVSDTYPRINENGETIEQGDLSVRDAFGQSTEQIKANGGVEALLRGLGDDFSQELDLHVVDDLRSFLFGQPGAGGIDLASFNIQRGRDLGLPSYNELRETLGLGRVESFDEITSNAELADKLEQLYGDVDQVDLWIGGLAEDPVNGGLLGELFATVVIDQFERVRDGDPFWSQNGELPQEELDALWSTTLSDVIERNTDIDVIQDQVFYTYDRIGGGEEADVLAGGELRDLLIGLGGDDQLDGGDGDDQILGGEGADFIIGGLGDDILEGGAGGDVFALTANGGNDVIKDFAPGEDALDLSGLGIAGLDELSFADSENGVVLSFADGGSVTFEGLGMDDLDEDNFVLSA